MTETGLTSGNLPHASLANAELCVAHRDLHSTVEDEEDHLHLARILLFLDTRWRKIDHSGAEEGEGKELLVAEGGVGYFSSFDTQ